MGNLFAVYLFLLKVVIYDLFSFNVFFDYVVVFYCIGD